MRRDQQRATLAAFSEALRREVHQLPRVNLANQSQVVWQQLHNRLQWVVEPHVPPSLLGALLDREKNQRATAGKAWFRSVSPLRESTAMTRTYVAHVGETACCAYSADGRLFASGGQDGVLRVRDVADDVELCSFELTARRGGSAWVTNCGISHDGRWVFAACNDGTLSRWDVKRGTKSWSIDADKFWVAAFDHSPRSGLIATGGSSGQVRLWDMEGNQLRGFDAHIGWIRCLAFSPDGSFLVSGGDDMRLRVWNTSDGRLSGDIGSQWGEIFHRDTGEKAPVRVAHEDGVRCCAVASDGKQIASGGNDGTLRLWVWERGGLSLQIGTFSPAGGFVEACAFSPQGNRLVVGTMRSRDVSLLACRAMHLVATLQGPADGVTCCAYAPDGRVFATGSADGTVRLWDALQAEQPALAAAHDDHVTCCAYSPAGDWIVTGGHDGTVRVWDAASGRALAVSPDSKKPRSGEGLDRWIWCCAVAPGAASIAYGDANGVLTVWDLHRRQIAATTQAHESFQGVHGCAFSPDGLSILTVGDDVKLWSSEDLAPLVTLKASHRTPQCCAWSPNGSRAAVGYASGTLVVWGLGKFSTSGRGNPKPLAIVQADPEGVWSCAWSADGSLLATGGSEGRLVVWDATTGCARVGALEGHTGYISGCACSADGAWIASAGDDGTLRLWSAATRRQAAVFLAASRLTACAFGGSSRDICCTDGAGNVCILRLEGSANGQ